MGFAIGLLFPLLVGCNRNEQEEPAAEESAESEAPIREYYRTYADPKTGRIPPRIRHREQRLVNGMASTVLAKTAGEVIESSWAKPGPVVQGGRTRGVAIDAFDPNVIIAGSVSGGIWRSEDRGGSWTRATRLDQIPVAGCVVQDTRPWRSQIWYACTGEDIGSLESRMSGDGIFRSTDGGRSWTRLQSTVSDDPTLDSIDTFDYVNSLVVDVFEHSQNLLYAATATGVLRTMDDGATWTKVLDKGVGHYRLVQAEANLLIAAADSSEASAAGVFYSVDKGLTWNGITPPGFGGLFEHRLAVARSAKQVYIKSAGQKGDALFRLDYSRGIQDSRWVNLSDKLPPGYKSQLGYSHVISVDPTNNEQVYLGGVDLYSSFDGAATTFRAIREAGWPGPLHADEHVLAYFQEPLPDFLVANDGGVFHVQQDASGTWKSDGINSGYVTMQFYTVGVNHERPGSMLVCGGTQDNGTWLSGGRDYFQHIGGGDGMNCALVDDYVFRTDHDPGMDRGLVDELKGVVDSEFVKVISSEPVRTWFDPWVLDRSGGGAIYLSPTETGGIWRNRAVLDPSDPDKWEQASSPGVESTRGVTAMAVSESNPPHRLFWSKEDYDPGIGMNRFRLYYSDDALGKTLVSQDISGPAFPVGGYLRSIAIDPQDANSVLIAFSNYGVRSVYYTDDLGADWTDVSGSLEENPDGSGAGVAVRTVAILPLDNKETLYLAGTSAGLFATERLNGDYTEWTQLAEDVIGNAIVDMIDVRTYDGFIGVATHGSGIFRGFLKFPVPEHMQPNEGASVAEGDVRLQWYPVGWFDGTVTYDLEVAREPWLSEKVDLEFARYNFVGAGFDVIGLATDQKYYWRIRAHRADGYTTQWSNAWWFTTRSIATSVEVPSTYGLAKIDAYPNPTRGDLTVSWPHNESPSVDVSVYDLMGRRLKFSRYEAKDEYRLDLSDLPAGLYFLKVESDTARQTRTVVKVE